MSWPLVSLDQHVEILSGFAFRSDLFNTSGDGLPLVRIRDVVVGHSETFYSGEFSDDYLLKNGDLLIGMDGDFNRARWNGGKALLNQRVCKVTAKADSLDQSYLYHFLPKALNKIHAETPAVTVKHLSVKGVRGIEIPLPPLAEQKRIAAILDKADAIRRKRQQAIQLADEFLRAVFLDMFGDPVTNPKGWEVKLLGDLVDSGPTNGLYKPSTEYGSGIRILRIDGFYNGVLSPQEKLKRVNLGQKEIEKYQLKDRSIVINRVNSRDYLGKSAFVERLEEVTVFESNMMNFSVKEEIINSCFLVHQLQTPYIKNQVLKLAKDAVNQSSINQQDVKSLEVIVPNLQLQTKFEILCKRYKNSLTTREESLFNCEAIFSSLSQRAFSGQL